MTEVGGDHQTASGGLPDLRVDGQCLADPVQEVVGPVVGYQRRVHHGQIDVLTNARGMPLMQGRQGGHQAMQTGIGVRQGGHQLHRSERPAFVLHGHPLRLAVHESRFRVDDGRIGCAAGLGPIGAKSGDGEHDQTRILFGERCVIEAQPCHDAGAEVLDEYVRTGSQPSGQCRACRRRQVHADIPLACVLLKVIPGQPGDLPAPQAGQIPVRRFQLDHVGTQVRQHPPGERTGENPGQVQHFETIERHTHAGGA